MKRNWILWAAVAAVTVWMLPSTAAAAGDAAAGKALFDVNCMSCHGATGKGDGPVGAALNPKPRDLSVGAVTFDTDDDGEAGTDTDIINVISNGAAAYGGSALMAPWPAFSDEDKANLLAYIRSLKQ